MFSIMFKRSICYLFHQRYITFCGNDEENRIHTVACVKCGMDWSIKENGKRNWTWR